MNFMKLQFSDGRPDVEGINSVNAVLRSVGVRASTIVIPDEAKTILEASSTRAITQEEQSQLVSIFYLNRAELLEQIELAGRTPEMPRGGYLATEEGGNAPYPKVYDMQSLTPEQRIWVLNYYGRLHVNTADSGLGIDEVMTVVAGGPFTWMFLLPDGVLARLTVLPISSDGPAVRLSYPGIGMHAGYMDPTHGLIVAFAHGPENFVIRFEDPSVPNADMLNTNPWVDFSGALPKLRDKAS